MNTIKTNILIFLLLFFSNQLFSQIKDTSYNSSDYPVKKVIPGKQYKANWLHGLFFGTHWRDLWTTPLNVEILDLDKFDDGINPVDTGGGQQTKSLQFKSKKGKSYKFRSFDKDVTLALSPELRGSFAQNVMQDQISTSNPFAQFVVSEFLDKVGIINSKPKLFIIPDSYNLGIFRTRFSGMLGTIEQKFKDNDIEGFDTIKSTVKLLNELKDDNNLYVNSCEFLKARLIDIFVGDWDRHKDQWGWARKIDSAKNIYSPVPKDRDQAFSKFDGLFPMIAESIILQFNNFGYNYPAMKFMTWSGRYIDQRFLTFLTKQEWDSVTNFVYSNLSDNLIEESVKKIPEPQYKIAKDEIIDKLKSRRNQLKEASLEYYELVNSVVDIYTSDDKDYIEINFKNNKTYVSIFNFNDYTNEKYGEPVRSKLFDNEITDEIRIYLLKGKDKVVITGYDNNSPKIRIINEKGKDKIIDKSNGSVYFYENKNKSEITKGEKTKCVYGEFVLPFKKSMDSLKSCIKIFKKNISVYKDTYSFTNDKIYKYKIDSIKFLKDIADELLDSYKYDPQFVDRGTLTTSMPLLKYNNDIGILFGGVLNLYGYGFRAIPYLYKIQITAGYAPKKKEFSGLYAEFFGTFNELLKNTAVYLNLRKSGIEVNQYFDLGNETNFDPKLYQNGYYKVTHEEYKFNTSFEIPRNSFYKLNVSASYKFFRVEQNAGTLIDIINPYGYSDKLSTINIAASLIFDNRDHTTSPYKGFFITIGGSNTPKLFNNSNSFSKINADVRSYFYLKTFTDFLFSFRIKGEKIFGDHPFNESSFIGGLGSIRGYPSERFAGSSSLVAGTELKIKLFKMMVLVPEYVLLTGFAETGRVFVNNENSKAWHTGYGGGLAFHIINQNVTLSLSLATSIEKKLFFYFHTGFGF
jgi:hypothetical protein